jgi:uncharacterized protein (TIGR02569 family)
VLRAFGSGDPPRRLPGGIRAAWHTGDLVLKRSRTPPDWLSWEERVLDAARSDRVRIQRPRRALDGALSVDGWVAHEFLEGAHRPGMWLEIIEAGDAFHAALAAISTDVASPMPSPRTDAWAVADRVAWGEAPLPPGPVTEDRILRELLDARQPVGAAAQLVHGDLAGNVLFADGEAPAIIDFSPYQRPPAYAIGVIVADAVVWEGADLALLDRVAERKEFGQSLLRALIFRHVTALLLPGRLPTGDAARRYTSLRRMVVAPAAGRR